MKGVIDGKSKQGPNYSGGYLGIGARDALAMFNKYARSGNIPRVLFLMSGGAAEDTSVANREV